MIDDKSEIGKIVSDFIKLLQRTPFHSNGEVMAVVNLVVKPAWWKSKVMPFNVFRRANKEAKLAKMKEKKEKMVNRLENQIMHLDERMRDVTEEEKAKSEDFIGEQIKILNKCEADLLACIRTVVSSDTKYNPLWDEIEQKTNGKIQELRDLSVEARKIPNNLDENNKLSGTDELIEDQSKKTYDPIECKISVSTINQIIENKINYEIKVVVDGDTNKQRRIHKEQSTKFKMKEVSTDKAISGYYLYQNGLTHVHKIMCEFLPSIDGHLIKEFESITKSMGRSSAIEFAIFNICESYKLIKDQLNIFLK
jgi:hypothetical protein